MIWSFLEREFMTLSSSLVIAKSVENFFLKPNWAELRILFNDKKESNLLYTIFSNIFDMHGKREMGR